MESKMTSADELAVYKTWSVDKLANELAGAYANYERSLERTAALTAQNKAMREYIEADAYCPCCGEVETCAEDCTFRTDCSESAERFDLARSILAALPKEDKP